MIILWKKHRNRCSKTHFNKRCHISFISFYLLIGEFARKLTTRIISFPLSVKSIPTQFYLLKGADMISQACSTVTNLAPELNEYLTTSSRYSGVHPNEEGFSTTSWV